MKIKNPFRKKRKSVSIVTLNGMIATGRGLNDAGLAPALEKAFSKKPDAVALVINSPGGSPVQSSLIGCLLYTSPSPRDRQKSRMPSSA